MQQTGFDVLLTQRELVGIFLISSVHGFKCTLQLTVKTHELRFNNSASLLWVCFSRELFQWFCVAGLQLGVLHSFRRDTVLNRSWTTFVPSYCNLEVHDKV